MKREEKKEISRQNVVASQFVFDHGLVYYFYYIY